MTAVECSPDAARAVAGRLTRTLEGVATASASLSTTANSNSTFDLTIGMSMLTSECVEEVGLVASVLSNLASSVEYADVFAGAGAFFAGQADLALSQLVGSLSDGRGDLGRGTPRNRYDRLVDEIWPDGIPAGISDADLASAIISHPRSLTMTPTELAAIWPLLPEAGRAHVAARQPVTVLDLVVDGGLRLTDSELDAAARSILLSPPSAEVVVDRKLADALRAAAFDSRGVPRLDRTGVALDRADILMAAGAAGRDYRDATNMGITYVMLVVGLQAGGTAQRTDDGLIVVSVPRDATIDVGDLIGTGAAGPAVQPYGKGGTTFGNTFVVPERDLDSDLIGHENVHTYQWAAAGAKEFGGLYLTESVKSGVQDFVEHVDVGIGVVDVGPLGPSEIPSVDLPVPGKWLLPDWVPARTPSIPIPQLDPPPIPVPDIDVEWTFNTGCHNRFEEHAGLKAGGYEPCEP